MTPMIASPQPITDAERRRFLSALDAAPFEVTQWEAEFLERNLTQRTYTVPQRAAIDRMMEQYSGRLP
jgi:hypothetical protein